MKSNTMKTVIAGLVAVAVIAVGADAFAGKGMGNQDDDRGYGGHGNHHRRGGCSYGQMMTDLTPEQHEQMESEHQAFFDVTKRERQDLYAKKLELRAEMAKSEPDLKKASTLQTAVTELQGSLDQKRLSHIMAMRKIHPDVGRGFMMKGRGMGRNGMGNCRNK